MLPKRRVFATRRPLLSVVVPCYNETDVLAHTHERLSRVLDALPEFDTEQIYVDDGSADGTWDLINSLVRRSGSTRAIRLSRNFGHQGACLAGLRESRGDAVVVIDADLQDPPEVITEMAARWLEGWSVVSARRRSRAGETVFKRATAAAFYRVLSAVSDRPPELDTGDFRLMDRELVDLLSASPEQDLYLRGAVSWFGLPETSVTFDRAARFAGTTKYTLRKMLALSRNGLLANSSLPLRLPAYLGALTLIGGATAATLRRDVRLLASSGAFGVQALALGVVGEYLGAVLRQVRGRPHYVVGERLEAIGASVPEPVHLEERVAL
ncbi:glycosyltransferase family 2 protein [Kitasatospora sp. NPDC004799]|uniref:glycosyltransferase family 2 protein n=1 Tax=Kitasatospora sp. NPDC004799 TaxID=3154460 RepID=UPI0033AD71BC